MIVKTLQNYKDLYAESINDSNTFWSNIANRLFPELIKEGLLNPTMSWLDSLFVGFNVGRFC